MLRTYSPSLLTRRGMQTQLTQKIRRSRRNSTDAPTRNAISTLPRLPIPDLHQTLQRYLTSLEPFLLEDAARGGPSYEAAYATRKRWADDFESGLGMMLQERLYALDRESPNNWLDDNIWLKKAYHEYREPLLINSNWWLAFKNDTNVPVEVLTGQDKTQEIDQTGLTYWQIRRAAWLMHRLLDFKMQLERQEIWPETTRTGLWFRRSTALIFNVSRIPQPRIDTFSSLPSPSDPSARTVLLSVRDWTYAVEVIDTHGRLIPAKELESRLYGIAKDVSKRMGSGESAVPVSVLSADHRDKWTENLQHLLSLSPENHSVFHTINSSILALSLDHYTNTLPTSSTSSSTPIPPGTPQEIDAHLHNIRSARNVNPAHNRWFDKPLTLIVESNTRAGAMGEHSPCDALVPSIVCEYAVVQSVEAEVFDHKNATEMRETGGGWKRLDWVTDGVIEKACEDAEECARVLVEDSDDGALWFEEYGSDWIKNEARQSPDAYIQMALQLAWYRTRGSFTATYETALTRLFHHGRTETIRTLSRDSRAFVLAMQDPSSSNQTRLSLLSRAVQTHTNLTRSAATGKGFDRHLLGLYCMVLPQDNDGLPHSLFEDELYKRSQTWKLSTSGLSAGHQFRGTGFGASQHDGYGINYLAGPGVIKFGIESKYSCPSTSTQGFKQAIMQSLIDMRTSVLSCNNAHL